MAPQITDTQQRVIRGWVFEGLRPLDEPMIKADELPPPNKPEVRYWLSVLTDFQARHPE